MTGQPGRARYRIERRAPATAASAQAEHGGHDHALASGLYRRAGPDAEIRMGGPLMNPLQLMFAGRVDAINRRVGMA